MQSHRAPCRVLYREYLPVLSLPLPTTAGPANQGAWALSDLLGGRGLHVAANRGPARHRILAGRLESTPAAGGLVTALLGVADHLPLTWIATAMGQGDRLAASQPPARRAAPGSPRIRFVIASEEALDWFYQCFANPILWFLQHGMWDLIRRPDLPAKVERGWTLGYRPINEAFARAVELEVRGVAEPVVLIHDYHLYLLPGLLRERVPGALLQHFTHIPWPAPEAWEPLLPAIRRQICEGLLGADIAGFQTGTSADNFLRCCDAFVPGAHVDYARGTVSLEGRLTRARAYPISIDPDALQRLAAAPETHLHKERLRSFLGERTIVRVDRLGPSKNIALGFRAFGLLLERRPDLVGRVRFLAFLVPSRETLQEYLHCAQEVWQAVEAVNGRFGREGWKPIEVFYEDNRSQAVAGMSLADVLLVNPVADGMNLVAKEGPMVNERDAVLVLSQECGAHAQLGSAVLAISPLDVVATAGALERALEMPAIERSRRIAILRASIGAEDLSWWIRLQLHDMLDDSRPFATGYSCGAVSAPDKRMTSSARSSLSSCRSSTVIR